MAYEEANEQLARQLIKRGYALYHPLPVWPDPRLDSVEAFVERLKSRVLKLVDVFHYRLPLGLRLCRVGIDPFAGGRFYIDRPATWCQDNLAASYRAHLADNYAVLIAIGVLSRSYLPGDLLYLADGDVEWAAVEVQRRLARECQRCPRCGPLVDSVWHGDPADVGPFDDPPARAYLVCLALKLSRDGGW
ncbi:hypothetical protein BOX15_Mlig005939g1 [Macrostomum lignano]|uniref:Uncharacterized protein n=1 Tax=Macrostomum lignano TaxID=282301 RepID=A0A267H0T2_9PLAT|nr:hypothetical protein BOX15_Mlig005939g1 [Macrostomum lignano]